MKRQNNSDLSKYKYKEGILLISHGCLILSAKFLITTIYKIISSAVYEKAVINEKIHKYK